MHRDAGSWELLLSGTRALTALWLLRLLHSGVFLAAWVSPTFCSCYSSPLHPGLLIFLVL